MALRGRGSYNVEVKFEGNWVKFNTITSSSNILLVMATRQGQKEFATAYKSAVQKNISTSGKRFGYQQNSPNYLRWKLNRGGPPQMLNWSRSFYSSIEVIENSTGTRFMVGIPKGIRRPSYRNKEKNRLTVSEYANVLEHGTHNMPSRPIFSDTFKLDMGGKAGLKKYIEFAIIRKFGSSGIRVNKI